MMSSVTTEIIYYQNKMVNEEIMYQLYLVDDLLPNVQPNKRNSSNELSHMMDTMTSTLTTKPNEQQQ